MEGKDLQNLLSQAARNEEGFIRATASLYVPGKIMGPVTRGTRKDDPNDTVFVSRLPSGDERPARPLIFINNTDARRREIPDDRARTGEKRVPETLFASDFSASQGSGNVEFKPVRYGHEYVLDPPVIARSFLSARSYRVKPWEYETPVPSIAAGTFKSAIFDPLHWKHFLRKSRFRKNDSGRCFLGRENCNSL